MYDVDVDMKLRRMTTAGALSDYRSSSILYWVQNSNQSVHLISGQFRDGAIEARALHEMQEGSLNAAGVYAPRNDPSSHDSSEVGAKDRCVALKCASERGPCDMYGIHD